MIGSRVILWFPKLAIQDNNPEIVELGFIV